MSNATDSYSFNVVAVGADDAKTTHSQPMTFTSTFDFTLSGSTTLQTIPAGGIATYNLDLSPAGGMFPSAVSLSCTGLPSGSTCGLAPPSLSPRTGETEVVVTIGTTPPIIGSLVRRNLKPWYLTLWLFVPGIIMAGTVGLRKKHGLHVCAALLILLLAGIELSCGGGGGGGSGSALQPGTPSGSYTITVTARCGALSHSIGLPLKIQ
jgi:hypothetical protein